MSEEKATSIDERVALIKQERKASESDDSVEQPKSELMQALARRQQRSSAGSPQLHEMPEIKEGDETETTAMLLAEKGSEAKRALSPDDDVFTSPGEELKLGAAATAAAAAAPDVKAVPKEERKSPDGQETAELGVKETTEASATPERQKEDAGEMRPTTPSECV